MTYQAPVADIAFTLNHIAGFSGLLERGMFEDLDAGTARAILDEAGKFATEVLAPTNRAGDEQQARLENGRVIMPEGWTEVYRKWVEAGWGSLPCPKEHGGQGLPVALSMAVNEMWNSANMAFALNPILTQAGVDALGAHGSEALQQKYLPKLITGEWTGSMQLTEPQAGSDLRFLKARAAPQGDGSYKLSGTKIFVTYGEHPMTENIIHMVLARLPDAPQGTKGISLFLVPKFLVNDDGSLGERNDVYCTKLEHKLGIHGSPTCVLNYGDHGGAAGWLVGEPHGGLKAMLTMMIQARIAVGVQGVGIAERAYQHALAYARERRQGQAETAPDDASAPIILHPDVKRMLLTMKAKTAAARAICYAASAAMDVSLHSRDERESRNAGAKAALLTPVAKAFSTDLGAEVASEAIQVHGGMGYIEETGAAQYYRDARIAMIYEGTNGIQAIDLVTRKLPLQDGGVMKRFIQELKETVGEVKGSNEPSFGAMGERLEEGVAALEETTLWLLKAAGGQRGAALAGATPYMRLFGLAAGGAYLAKGALAAARAANGEDEARKAHILTARHFAANLVPEASSLRTAVTGGYETILAADAGLLA